ncbi:MAG TPA: choice-of-anchor tandem repeat GloVer-containing protein [Candidatus Solibacter sp.]|nr:choice-of-anchor tandem repeat GloVer-containing protein [Candidatus Solibacter sp.]
MRRGKITSAMVFAVLLVVSSLSLTNWTAAQIKTQIVHTFDPQATGFPASGLTPDQHGNLYGVTGGSVYQLTPAKGGVWNYHVIKFLPGGRGAFAAGKLAIDAAGNLYGATWQDGTYSCGYVYEVSPPSSGYLWNLSILHEFDCTDGAGASYGLTFDAAGNLYGGTHNGGSFSEGVAYELSPSASGWTYTILHEFSNAEGNGPQTAMVFDKNGNLFGGNETSIYELSPNGDGTWTFSTAFAFTDATGFNPLGDPFFDAAGNLYDTNQAAGLYHSGAAFMLTNTSGVWNATVLHSFNSQNTNDGYYPEGALAMDTSGNLYGTTQSGGGKNNSGIVFELSPTSSGEWTETVLHRFGAFGSSGGTSPGNALYLDPAGNIYGTAAAGGDTACLPSTGGCGVIYKLLR